MTFDTQTSPSPEFSISVMVSLSLDSFRLETSESSQISPCLSSTLHQLPGHPDPACARCRGMCLLISHFCCYGSSPGSDDPSPGLLP